MEQPKEKRTWLAVTLALLVTGLGHLYLRRWLRAVGWVLLAFGASMFVPAGVIEALANGTPPSDVTVIAPILVVGLLSIADAYLVARQHNAQVRAQTAAAVAREETGTTATCPACGREVDTDLDFCHWCTTKLDRPTDD